MTNLATAASRVGAGESQGRYQSLNHSTRLTDQQKSSEDLRSAALQLLQSTLQSSGTTGRDLDVLA